LCAKCGAQPARFRGSTRSTCELLELGDVLDEIGGAP
jgi:hypothetical protein